MVKHLFRLLLTALLVMVPAAILLTGNAEWLPVAKWSAFAFGAVVAAGCAITALNIRAAKGFKRSDFGEKAHNALIKFAVRDANMSALNYHFHAIRGALSAVLFLALGLLPSAMVVGLSVVAVYIVRGATENYYFTHGKQSGSPGRSRHA